LWSWQLQRLPECAVGYSLDLDSIVFERYGHQQGALRGPNPRKHGRPSHHPLVAELAEAHFLLHGWLRSGNCGTARGAVEFLKQALALLPENTRSAWCAPMPAFCRTTRVAPKNPVIAGHHRGAVDALAKARSRTRHRLARSGSTLRGGEFSLQLLGGNRPCRFVVIREQLRAEHASLGRKLLEVPGYTFRVRARFLPRAAPGW
jgi:hypothetical protein